VVKEIVSRLLDEAARRQVVTKVPPSACTPGVIMSTRALPLLLPSQIDPLLTCLKAVMVTPTWRIRKAVAELLPILQVSSATTFTTTTTAAAAAATHVVIQ